MFCYIKYSSHLIHAFRSPNITVSNESMCRKGRTKMRGDDLYIRALLENKSNANEYGEENSFSLTNQVVQDMCIHLIKQYRKSMVSEDVYGSQCFPIMLPDPLTEPQQQRHNRKTTVKIDAATASRPRNSQKLELKIEQFENDSLMVNPDCYVRILIDYIRETLEIDKNIQIDLCDSDGNLLMLHELKPYENARCRLIEKNVYYLIYVNYDSDSDRYLAIYPVINGNTTEEMNILFKYKALGYKMSDTEHSVLSRRSTRTSPRIRMRRKRGISSAL